MLKSLRIRNLATIEDLEIDFESGFTILTGETGAGKSILIGAIRLALGEKGSADFIRTGQTEASIEAVFGPPVPGVSSPPSDSEDEVLIQRQINGQGSGKVYIDGVLTPVRKLKETTDAFADIYGQNDHIFPSPSRKPSPLP